MLYICKFAVCSCPGKEKVDGGSDVRAEKIFVVRGGDEGAAWRRRDSSRTTRDQMKEGSSEFCGEIVDHTGGRDKVFPKHSGKGSRRANVVTLGLWRMFVNGKKRLRISKHQTKSSTDAEERGGDWPLSKMKDKQRKKRFLCSQRVAVKCNKWWKILGRPWTLAAL